MASLRNGLTLYLNKTNFTQVCCRRFLNYSAMNYDGPNDPAPSFFKNEVQSILKNLTRVNYNKVFRRRKLGSKILSDPEYKFMTDEDLKKAMENTKEKAEQLLQIPPVVKVRDPSVKVLSRDHALKGLETSRMVFTDITYGIKDSERLIVIRELDGTLQEAEWSVRQRMNQVYFPHPGKLIKAPRMFDGEYFQSLLDRNEYEYILDRACIQFEPEDQDFQKVATIVYQHLNDNNKFELLRSTRHFGSLVFFLVWNKNIDNLLIELIETLHMEEAGDLVSLYSIIHKIDFQEGSHLDKVQEFVKKFANKKGALELAVQAYKDVTAQKQQVAN